MLFIAQGYQPDRYHQESHAFEPYGHYGEQVSSPIDDNSYQASYDANHHATQSSQWVQQFLSRPGSMDTDTSIEVPDESRRRSIARCSDEIHASGFHGLESDKDCTFYSRRSSSHPIQPRSTPPAPAVVPPSRDQSIANWNQQVTPQRPEAPQTFLASSRVSVHCLLEPLYLSRFSRLVLPHLQCHPSPHRVSNLFFLTPIQQFPHKNLS